ncbi:MalM family protein, partial [Vibrio paucivorans]
AIIVDKNGKELESYEGSDFEYKKPRLHLGNRIVAEKDFYPPNGEESVYLIVYSKPSDLNGTTDVIHPARLDAEGRGNYLPEVKDIPIPHANVGRIEIDIEGAGRMIIGTDNSTKEPYKKAPVDAQPETQSYYHNAIKKAVEADDLPKALSLLDEAKALNIEGAQEVFVKAVNSKK